MAGMNSMKKALLQLFIFLKYSIILFIPNYLTNIDFNRHVLNKNVKKLIFCFLLAGCASDNSYMVHDPEKNTSEYNLLDSPDGMQDPNLRAKTIIFKY